MSSDSAAIEALSEFIRRRQAPMPLICIISDIDPVTLTCYCQPIDGSAGITDVRLMASASIGFLILPKDQSQVGISFINDNTAWVSMFSEVDEVQLNGVFYGGLTKTLELQIQLNKMNAQLQAVITAAEGWPVSPGDGGAAFKAAVVAGMTGLMPGDFTNIENNTVKHGDGT